MKNATHPNTRYSKGSTGYHTAIPQQASDGCSGGVPLGQTTPPLRKPAVLATRFPEPSQGTPGTAICAVINHPGPVLPRQQHGDSGVESSLADRRRALVKRVKTKVKQWQVQIHGYYLAHMRKHVALTTKRTFRFVRLIAFPVRVSRWMWFRRPALPYGAMNRFVHDRRFALFRRRAVSYASGGQRVITIQRPPLRRVEAGVRSTVTRLTNVLNKKTNNMKKTIKIGLSAMMAFAFMFATSLSVVAQETTAAPADRAEVEFVEAETLAHTVQKLHSKLWNKAANANATAKPNVKESAARDKAPMLTQERWFLVDVSGADDPADPEESEQILTQALAANAAKPCNESEIICAVKLIMPASTNPASLQNLTVQEARTLTDVDLSPTEPDPYAYFNQ